MNLRDTTFLATRPRCLVRWAVRIDEFDGNKDDWPQYVGRLGYFFDANGIADEKKRAVFLSVVGAATNKTLRNLLSPTKPNERSYDELIAVLTKHFKPAPSEKFKFHSRSRKPDESVAIFIAELRSLAELCNFGDTLEPMLRYRVRHQRRCSAEKAPCRVQTGLWEGGGDSVEPEDGGSEHEGAEE